MSETVEPALPVMLLCDCDERTTALLRTRFELCSARIERGELRSAHPEQPTIRALVTRGDIGASSDIMRELPALGIVACYGVGYDAIDLAYARDNGIAVTNTPDVLTHDVADMALALMLALMRDIVGSHAFVASGNWATRSRSLVRRFYGSRVGIVGFGRVGRSVARRVAAFDAAIGYFDVAQQDVADTTFFADLTALAAWSDVLVVTLAGGPQTRGIVDRDVLEALGPAGYLVNVSRGSVVDEAALLDALEQHRIAGAGLDVFSNEPDIDARYLRLNNVVLQPHHASATVETREAMGQLVFENLVAYFGGGPLPTPV